MRFTTVGFMSLVLAIASPLSAQTAAPQRSILAIFAHPDDEILVAPLLSRYAREGAKVTVAFMTKGENSAPMTDLEPGDAIAARRANEARCSAAALGINAPLLFEYGDASLGERTPAAGSRLADLATSIAKLFADERPDIVLTWGPDGGYGHPDHRLVSAVVTQLVQKQVDGSPQRLLYPGIPNGSVPEVPEPGDAAWISTDDRFLTVKVPFEQVDLAATSAAFACYTSQLPPAVLSAGPQRLQTAIWQGRVHLRPWNGGVAGDDLFALRSGQPIP